MGDMVALYSETVFKMRLFPSKSDTWVKGATDHVAPSARSWQLPSSSAYSSLPLSLQNDVFESLVHIWPLWGLIYDSREFFFFSNCINLYILNEALGYSTSVSGLHASGSCRDIMVVFSKDWFNQTKSPNLESNPSLANQIHSAKNISLWFMAKQCLHCHWVKKVWRMFLENSAELGRESGKENLLLLLTPQSGQLGTVKAVVGTMVVKSRLVSSLIIEASAVLVMKSWQNYPSSFTASSGPFSSNFITPAKDTFQGLRSSSEQIGQLGGKNPFQPQTQEEFTLWSLICIHRRTLSLQWEQSDLGVQPPLRRGSINPAFLSLRSFTGASIMD